MHLKIANRKPVFVLETGWPSAGNQISEAVPSLENASYTIFLTLSVEAMISSTDNIFWESMDKNMIFNLLKQNR